MSQIPHRSTQIITVTNLADSHLLTGLTVTDIIVITTATITLNSWGHFASVTTIAPPIFCVQNNNLGRSYYKIPIFMASEANSINPIATLPIILIFVVINATTISILARASPAMSIQILYLNPIVALVFREATIRP